MSTVVSTTELSVYNITELRVQQACTVITVIPVFTAGIAVIRSNVKLVKRNEATNGNCVTRFGIDSRGATISYRTLCAALAISSCSELIGPELEELETLPAGAGRAAAAAPIGAAAA